MFFKGDDLLRMAVFGEGEVFRAQAFGGFAVFVGDDYVDEDGAGFGFKDGAAIGLRGLAEDWGGMRGEDGRERKK